MMDLTQVGCVTLEWQLSNRLSHSRVEVENHFSANGYLDIYNIILRPYKSINLKISLLYFVKHLINLSLCLGRTRRNDFLGLMWPEGCMFPTTALEWLLSNRMSHSRVTVSYPAHRPSSDENTQSRALWEEYLFCAKDSITEKLQCLKVLSTYIF